MSVSFRQSISLPLGPEAEGGLKIPLCSNREQQTLTGAPGPPCGPAAPGGPASPLKPGGPLSPFPPGSPFWPCRKSYIVMLPLKKSRWYRDKKRYPRYCSEGNLNIKISMNGVELYCPPRAGGEGQSHVTLCVPKYRKTDIDTYWGSREASRPRKTLFSSFTLWKTTCQQWKVLER